MALLIGMYGHGRKVYAAVKFFLFTMIASMFMLAAILWLYAKTGSFDFVVIQNAIRSGSVPGFRCRRAVALPRLLHRLCRKGSALPSSTPGCRTRTWKRRPPARCCWRAFC